MSLFAERYDFLYKILLIGDSGVGKSSLLLRYTDGTFSDETSNTIGVDFKIKSVEFDGKTHKLQIWDTSGQERFRSITSSYYRGARGIFVVYDVTNTDSFANVESWIEAARKHGASDVTVMLVGNKSDNNTNRSVSYGDGKGKADVAGITFLETSAKDEINIQAAFSTLLNKMTQRARSQELQTPENAALKPEIRQGVVLENKNASYCCYYPSEYTTGYTLTN